ncbi:efflux RND transporter periplasmic adaptor subunit [Acinetobacter stercoris]|uniref:Cobalt-zinc-cadmium resistance protein CzcB n=1 Tax=Acinetobacter stercoris TaxID=2126983 RepID=A0A2U3N052_9GAMM|nr:efflux RND transporter periplasmic adaptor subunit [Acinetobacter stercoris]SPL71056.1 Cobalt-zinc-cadmium resistance protein CzcB [Acinetobacter stercoris]
MRTIKNQSGKVSQNVLIIITLVITAFVVIGLLLSSKDKKNTSSESDEHGHSKGESEGQEDSHAEEEILSLTAKQMAEQGLKLSKVAMGEIIQASSYPARLIVNTDRQAHVSPGFAGRVESVNVELGQQVKKGQVLASLLVPDLVDQQANLSVAQTNLQLAQQDYAREKELWSQGISAKQDYQRSYNAFKQAEIQVRAAKSRLAAFGVSHGSNGRYVITAPISGVISSKDLVVGENVQLATQLFTIDQLDQLWLEFIVPGAEYASIQPGQMVEFQSLQTGHFFKVQIQNLNVQADEQTGRLQVRAKVLSTETELRPNLMVNVKLRKNSSTQALRVEKSAIQQIEGKDAIFIAQAKNQNIEFRAVPVELGQLSGDGVWVEVKSGVSEGQQYVTQGSFLLKSELEKGEASHGH